jgi:predicted GNAT family acetyltransferase
MRRRIRPALGALSADQQRAGWDPRAPADGGDVEGELVDVAPAPGLAGLERADDRMLPVVSVGGRVTVRRIVAAADVAAFEAKAQMEPLAAAAQAVLASVDGLGQLRGQDVASVRTLAHGVTVAHLGRGAARVCPGPIPGQKVIIDGAGGGGLPAVPAGERIRPMAAAPSADIRVVDAPERSRFEIRVDGEVAGYSEYRRRPGLIAFIHTLIDPRFESHGLGSQLVRAELLDARSDGLSVLPFCPFVRSYIAGHVEYLDLVPEDMRGEFDLPAPA